MATTTVSLTKAYLSAHKNFRASNGITFCARMVEPGDVYGLNFCLTHPTESSKHFRDEPMVEFYDTRYRGSRFTAYGQFVSRYYVGTLLGTLPHSRPVTDGIDLCGGVSDWKIDADTMADVLAWLRQQVTTSS
jgi:hypothetical protein